jgi:hypothetical protein
MVTAPSCHRLNLSDCGIKDIESFSPDFSRAVDLMLAAHCQHRDTINRHEETLDLRYLHVELVLAAPSCANTSSLAVRKSESSSVKVTKTGFQRAPWWSSSADHPAIAFPENKKLTFKSIYVQFTP